MDDNDFEVVWTDEMLDEVFTFAQETFPEEFEIAVNMADDGDYDFLTNVINAANRILTSRSLSHLVELGLLEIAGIDETGDYMFQVTEDGTNYER